MSRRVFVFARKTLRDCSRPKPLLAFLIPYFGIAAFLAFALSDTVAADIGTAPLFTQEQVLVELFSQLSFVWLLAFPMVFVGVLTATSIAGEIEQGTFRLLLSKPIARWEPLVGNFIGVVIFGFLVALAGLLVGAVALVTQIPTSSLALRGSVFSLLPGLLVYALVVTLVIAAIGHLLAVVTRGRIRAALATLVVPVFFFVFIFVRFLPGVTEIYEPFHLYVVDVNYHLGNVYVAIQSAVGVEFNPATQQSLDAVAGVYDTAGTTTDPLLEGIVGSIPLSGYLPPAVSAGVLAIVTIAGVVGAVFVFERMDIP
jgi:ABC-type transport system involved in multi-copper enzyme maturation permease subunit